MNYIPRHYEQLVLDASAEYGAVMVAGPRQVGKTTMLLQLCRTSERRYVTLDDLNARELAKNDPVMFFQIYPPPVLVDEVQYAPELFSTIKLMVDRAKAPGSFWLTGSQPFLLMDLAQESLAGRAAVLHLAPLSSREIQKAPLTDPFVPDVLQLRKRAAGVAPATTPELFERIWRGSLPGLASGAYTNRDLFYNSYLQTYIGRDVRDISSRIDALDFMRFIRAVACRCSQMLNVHDLARDVGIGDAVARSWLGVLEKSDVIYYLHPYANNVLKRTVKTPKLYFFDTGLVAFLTRWSSAATLESGAMSGALFENYVINEIRKSYSAAGVEPLLYYYRDRDKSEIDVILERDGTLHPLEIKKTATPRLRMVSGFRVLSNAGLPVATGGIICSAVEAGALDGKTLIIPAWAL